MSPACVKLGVPLHLLIESLEYATSEVDGGNESLLLLIEIAAIHALRGDVEASVARLEEAVDAGFAMPLLVIRDPRFLLLTDSMAGKLAEMRGRVDALNAWPIGD